MSIRVRALTSEEAGVGRSYARINDTGRSATIIIEPDERFMEIVEQYRTVAVNVSITGLRRGNIVRFAEYTEEQAKQNIAFWSQATAVEK